ncbi:MAG: hypothetical protein AAFX40_02235 [Cyanobacteria bacterium J06639_1]
MNLRHVLDQLENSPGEAMSSLAALKQLNETVTEALLSCLRGDADLAHQELTRALPQWAQAMQALNHDLPEQHDSNPLAIASEKSDRKTIYINRNRAEVRVNDELRGSWSIWTVADLKEVCRLAEEFDCGLVYSSISAFSTPPKYRFPTGA